MRDYIEAAERAIPLLAIFAGGAGLMAGVVGLAVGAAGVLLATGRMWGG